MCFLLHYPEPGNGLPHRINQSKMKHKGLRKESVDEKTGYNKVSYAVKKEMITKIVNGQTSKRQAAFEYNVSRSTIDYWFKKFTTTNQKKQFMSKNDELKKLKSLHLLQIVFPICASTCKILCD